MCIRDRSQYDAVLQRTARTNNLSEGWHNRLQVIVGFKHPSLYAFFNEIIKEQADTESMLRQLELGQRVKKSTDPKHKRADERIYNIVKNYEEFVENNNILTYLRSIGHNVNYFQ